MEEMQFAFGVDANYVKYAGIVMTSIVLNHPGYPVCFHLICDGGLLPDDQARLDTFTRLYRNTWVFIYDAHQALAGIQRVSAGVSPERLSQTVFLRILMPMLLPRDVQRVIYCDADMLCVGRAESLWQLDLEGHPLAAVMEGNAAEKAARIRLKQDRYLNAGFLVIDLAAWREQGLTKKVLDCYRQQGQAFSLLEQDALNKVLDGDWLEISHEQVCLMNAFNPLDIQLASGNIFWHFLNEGKPWIRYADPQVAEPYWRYVHRSLWDTMEPEEPWEVRNAFLAGKNAERQGAWQDAAHYLGIAAQRLLEFYLEQTGQLSEEKKDMIGKGYWPVPEKK